MSDNELWATGRKRWLDWFQARLCRYARRHTRFITDPEPRTIGSYDKGQHLIDGKFLFAGHYSEALDTSIWDLHVPDAAFADAVHSFRWLDDLASRGGDAAAVRARDWTLDWIKRYEGGTGAGWRAHLAGLRVQRMLNHSVLLRNTMDEATDAHFVRVIGQHVLFLARRWKSAARGRPRFEALTGLIVGATTLEDYEKYAGPAAIAIARECALVIDRDGAVPSRSPEQLLDIFVLLTTAASALSDDSRDVDPAHTNAIQRIAPALRALRHADGGLCRFHGGGRGAPGRLDQALANSGVRAAPQRQVTMGFVRLTGGRTSILQDAAPPPAEAAPYSAHASTLSFELTSGRRPVIVNCGAGSDFGPEWRRAGRATPSHSTLGLDGYSSSRLGAQGMVRGQLRDRLIDAPTDVRLQETYGADGTSVLTGQNGYQPSHGLTHVRKLDLSGDGRTLSGEDTIAALSDSDRTRLVRMRQRLGQVGIAFSVRFHLHPDVEAEIDAGATTVTLFLKSSEVWLFRHDGHSRLSLEPSVYLEQGLIKPRATQQIVLSSAVAEHAGQVGWTLAKAQDTPSSVRDTAVAEPVFAS